MSDLTGLSIWRVTWVESETFQSASNSYCNITLMKPCAQSSLSLPQALISNQTHNSNYLKAV